MPNILIPLFYLVVCLICFSSGTKNALEADNDWKKQAFRSKLESIFTADKVLKILEHEKDPDDHKTMTELVMSKGYPIEEYYVTTEDKYILGVFRIPYGRNESSNTNKDLSKPIVFLQHGLLDSSFTFVNNFATQSLAFILADAGYDVWLGNNRGNTFSKKHETYKPDSSEFWDFSWDEMARYDAPDMINFVLNYTNQTTLAYVGHSEGTTQLFAMASTIKKETQNKIALFGGLAPVAYAHHCKSPILDILAILDVAKIFEILGINQFLPGELMHIWASDLCRDFDHICNDFLELIFGPSRDLNITRYQVYLTEFPADTSVQNMDHWSQMVNNEDFYKYDYGSDEKNEEHYGTKKPPKYSLANVTMPCVLYSGTHDWLADPTDVKALIEQLPASSIVEHNVIDGFGHMDFVWGEHANTKVYADLLQKIEKYLGPGIIFK